MVFDPARVAQNCEFCGSPALVDYKELKDPISPQSLLPFRVADTAVREQIRRWYASKWFAPGKLKARALVDTVHGVYLPYWTFDAQAHCPWRAEAGHYYYTTETVRNSQGRLETRQVQHVRWEPAAGRVDHFFDDEPVPGSQGVPLDLLRRIEPFPTADVEALRRRDGVGLRRRALPGGAPRRRAALTRSDDREAAGAVRRAVPGDTYRNLEIFPSSRAARSSTSSCRCGC